MSTLCVPEDEASPGRLDRDARVMLFALSGTHLLVTATDGDFFVHYILKGNMSCSYCWQCRQAELRLLGAPMPAGVPGSCGGPERESWLRLLFVQRVRSYVGTPYAQRHHRPGSPEFESPLFLDCCGLVRRALMDLRAELGFSVGPWNQAYLYDTLPLDVSGAADMQPGDLVFTTATYFDPKAKRHPHDVVHVEVWAGDGERTVAARWRRGRVQEFPSYRFDSAAYGDARYHFRSISTWLQGVCVSHCSEHAWGLCRRDFPSPKSIFYPDDGAECEDAGHVAQRGPQQKQQQQHRGVENSPPPPPSHDQWLVTTKPADSPPHGNNNNDDDKEESSSGLQHFSSALLPLQEVSAEKQQTLVGSSRERRRRRHQRASTCEPSAAPVPVRRAGEGGGDNVDVGGGGESATRRRRDARGVRESRRRTWEAVGGGARAGEEEGETPGWPQEAAEAAGGGRTGLPGDQFGLATVTLAVALALEALVLLFFVVL